MSGSARASEELSDRQYRLIAFVLEYLDEHDAIPPMKLMADAIGVTRQGVLMHMGTMAKRGWMPPRPKYAIHWFDLTDEGADAFRRAKAVRELREERSIRQV